MQRWKEKGSKSIQRIKDYFDAPKVYFCLFMAVISFFWWRVTHIYPQPIQIDADSARYFLSALVQTQAAILAIVVTLTLIAVQLVSSHYSTRVIDIFKTDPAIFLFLFFYGASIFFGLFTLLMIGAEHPDTSISRLIGDRVMFAYFFGFSTFAILFPYISAMFNILNPANIIKKLSYNIDEKNIVEYIKSLEEYKKDRTKPIKEDPVQPIVDIIRSSLIKHDFATTSSGINTITNRVIKVMNPNEYKISKHFCDHFEWIGKLAVNSGDEESVIEAIKNLEAFGESTAKKESVVTTAEVAKCLRLIGKPAAEKKYGDATRQAILSLRSVGKTAAENLLEGAVWQVARSIGAVGLSAEENGLREEVWQAARSIVLVGTFAEERGFGKAEQQAAECIRRLTTSSKEIVESAIKNSRSALEEKDRELFDKFRIRTGI